MREIACTNNANFDGVFESVRKLVDISITRNFRHGCLLGKFTVQVSNYGASKVINKFLAIKACMCYDLPHSRCVEKLLSYQLIF